MNDIVKKIKKKYLKKMLSSICSYILLLTLSLFILILIFILNDNSREVMFEKIIMFFICIYIIYCSIGNLKDFLNNLRIYKNPKYSIIFKKYGNEKQITSIIKNINKKIEFKDNNMIISDEYILGLKDVEYIIKLDDVKKIYKCVHKFNNTINYYSIVIIDKYNDIFLFKYPKVKEKDIIELIKFIHKKCKYSKLS